MSTPRQSCWRAALRRSAAAAALTLSPSSAFAQDKPDPFYEIESKYLFGFTVGSDIGLEGEKEISANTVGRFGKRDGRFAAFEHKLEFEWTPTQFMQLEFGLLGTTHRISGVTDLDHRAASTVSGASAELRYLVIGRGPGSPFGLTVSVEPEIGRIDDTSGERVRKRGLETRLSLDAELVPNRVFWALNLLYEPELVKPPRSFAWEREAEVGISTALAMRPFPDLVVGAELAYRRAYDGIGLHAFEGQAVYVGPTLYWQLTRKTFLQAAWSTQVAGHSHDEPDRRLDLDHFDRHRAKLKLAVEF